MKQGVYQQSTTQKYPIGLRVPKDDWVFRYCHAETALRPLIDGMNGNLVSIRGDTPAVIYPAGSRQIAIPMNPHSVHYVDEQKVDYWKGGKIWIMTEPWSPAVTGAGQFYQIKSSAPAVGGFVTLTLEDPLIQDVPADVEVNVWPNIYSNIVGIPSPFGGEARMSLVCVPLIPVTLGNYFWGLTWGPLMAHCGYSPGRAENDREMYWMANHYGCVPGTEVDFSTAGNAIPQRVGYVLTNTSPWTNMAGAAQLGSDNLFMLQLSP